MSFLFGKIPCELRFYQTWWINHDLYNCHWSWSINSGFIVVNNGLIVIDNGIYPLVRTVTQLLNAATEIVNLPIKKKKKILVMLVYPRVYPCVDWSNKTWGYMGIARSMGVGKPLHILEKHFKQPPSGSNHWVLEEAMLMDLNSEYALWSAKMYRFEMTICSNLGIFHAATVRKANLWCHG